MKKYNPLIGILVVTVLFTFVTNCKQTEQKSAEVTTETVQPGKSLGIASVSNLRDLGGYKTRDGSIIMTGKVYRANQLSGISPEDFQTITDLKLKSAYDLRTELERSIRPDELPDGVNYVIVDVLADAEEANPAVLEQLLQNPQQANAELGGGKAEAGFIESYRQFITLPSAQNAYRELFSSLGDEQKLPAVFHCTTGKDRTGWAAAAFLTLMGVSEDDILEDYLRSNEYILDNYKSVVDAFVEGGGDRNIPEAILGVRKEYLDAAFDEMQTQYGSIEMYFSEGLGIDAAQQKALRKLYLTQQ